MPDTLQEQVAREIQRWFESDEGTGHDKSFTQVADAILALWAAREAALVEALKRYGEHNDTCTRRQIGAAPPDPECDCGLDAALAPVKEIVATEEMKGGEKHDQT